MRELPILFSGSMVRAILDGSKTQTRRVVKPQPREDVGHNHVKCEPGDLIFFGQGPNARHRLHRLHESRGRNEAATGRLGARHVACPYGQPGDLLYVRETWALYDGSTPTINRDAVWYRADEHGAHFSCDDDRLLNTTPKMLAGEKVADLPWKPSIHMCKIHSRIKLRVTDVRVERVQEISLTDIRKEGTPGIHDPDDMDRYDVGCFRALWDSINAKRSPWSNNDWVWAITFEKETP